MLVIAHDNNLNLPLLRPYWFATRLQIILLTSDFLVIYSLLIIMETSVLG
jgi:hypothetical protein